MTEKQRLRNEFFRNVPKARRINPFFEQQFNLLYDASQACKNGQNLLNIHSSRDLSSIRANFFRSAFFGLSTYYELDFWQDQFIKPGTHLMDTKNDASHKIDYEDGSFSVVVTTKVILEHVSNPQLVLNELYRILKPGGKLFLIAPHIRRQHQAPYDYFRFTEYSLKMLLYKAGFSAFSITHCGGFMAVVGYYFYFFQRGLTIPRILMRALDLTHYYLIEPLFYLLDKLDNGYGRDMTLYFMVRAEK
jgi:SAM-dependent methyltransferase